MLRGAGLGQRGVRLRLCVRPRPHSLPRPSPNLRSDVAPSYSTFPCVSFLSRQSLGSLTGEAAQPREDRARGGPGWGQDPSAPRPFPPPLACTERLGWSGGRRGLGTGVSTRSVRPSRLSALSTSLPTPARSPVGTRPRSGASAGAAVSPGPLLGSHLRKLAPRSSVGREVEEGERCIVAIRSKAISLLRGSRLPPNRENRTQKLAA